MNRFYVMIIFLYLLEEDQEEGSHRQICIFRRKLRKYQIQCIRESRHFICDALRRHVNLKERL